MIFHEALTLDSHQAVCTSVFLGSGKTKATTAKRGISEQTHTENWHQMTLIKNQRTIRSLQCTVRGIVFCMGSTFVGLH